MLLQCFALAPDIYDEKAILLANDVNILGSYAHAVEISNGMPPPAYEEVHPRSQVIPPRPSTPPSTTLISIYSEPIRVEYEEGERIHRAGCGNLIWNYYACCGYMKDTLFASDVFNYRMTWTIIGCFCCLLPVITLLLIYFYI